MSRDKKKLGLYVLRLPNRPDETLVINFTGKNKTNAMRSKKNIYKSITCFLKKPKHYGYIFFECPFWNYQSCSSKRGKLLKLGKNYIFTL